MLRGQFRPIGLSTVSAAAIVALLVLAQTQLVAPKSSAAGGFSQEHAYATLARLLADGKPHLGGSGENAAVRDRIVAELRDAGYAPQIQTAFHCMALHRYAGCARIENVVAVHHGTGAQEAVLATAHYDTVPATVGVADDGAGVAVLLELARSMARRATRNDVIFLMTDGEETGLMGARAFADLHPLMKRVRMVLNFEARGASGPSMMFETGAGNARLIALFARTVEHPSANSLMYEIYKVLPNDTDFSVYKARGVTGLNFAFINSASLYHSARDDLQHLDRASLQQHGDNAFALTTVLADADLELLKSESDASYFDVFGRALVVWPAAVNLPVALVALLVIGGLVVARRSVFSCRAVAVAVLALIAVPVLMFAVGWLLSYPLGIWPGVHPIDHAHPWAGRIGLAASAMLVGHLVAIGVARRVNEQALFLTTWTCMALLAVVVAVLATGASFLLVWPVSGVAIAAWIQAGVRRRQSLQPAAIVGLVLVAFFWIPYVVLLEAAIGWDSSQFKILVFAPFVLAQVPALVAGVRSVRPLGLAAAVSALTAGASIATASRVPAFAEGRPRGLNVVYYDDRSAHPRWRIGFKGGPDRDYLTRNGFPLRDETDSMFELFDARGHFKPASDLALVPPALVLNEVRPAGALNVARGTLRSGRGGFRLVLGAGSQSGIRSIRLADEDVLGEGHLDGEGPIFVRIAGLADREIPIELAWDADKRPSMYVIEHSNFPDSREGRALVASRPANAAPIDRGDATVVGVHFELRSPTAGSSRVRASSLAP